MFFNGNRNNDRAGGVFESADVPGPVFSEPIEHSEIVKIIGSERFQRLRAEAKRRERTLRASRAADAAL